MGCYDGDEYTWREHGRGEWEVVGAWVAKPMTC